MPTFVEQIPHLDIDVLRDHWRRGCENINIGCELVKFSIADNDNKVPTECSLWFADGVEYIALAQRRAGQGMRVMFVCPHCYKFCRKLYKWGWLACRKCHGLKFASAGLSNAKSAKLVLARLKYRTGIELRGFPRRRKGQRTKHFEKQIQRMPLLARRAMKARGWPDGSLFGMD